MFIAKDIYAHTYENLRKHVRKSFLNERFVGNYRRYVQCYEKNTSIKPIVTQGISAIIACITEKWVDFL